MTPISNTSTTRTFTRIQIAGYRIGEPQGRWGSVAAFAALRPGSGESVQMRVLLPPAVDDAALRQRFVAVGRRAQGLQHRHLAACHDAGEEGRRVYQVWEPRFSTLQRAAAATPRDALRVAMECARALEAIHHDGLAHGQVGVEQIWVRQDSITVLGPFGLPPVLLARTVLERLELNRQCGGTLAPELLINGGEPDLGTDLYALAAMLAQLLGITLPCPTTSEQLQRPLALRFHVSESLSLPADLVRVLATALAPQASARYASASHLREDLERLYFDFAPIHAGDALAPPPPRRSTAVIHPPTATQVPRIVVADDGEPIARHPAEAATVATRPALPQKPAPSAIAPSAIALSAIASSAMAPARFAPPADPGPRTGSMATALKRVQPNALWTWPPPPAVVIAAACLLVTLAAILAMLLPGHRNADTVAGSAHTAISSPTISLGANAPAAASTAPLPLAMSPTPPALAPTPAPAAAVAAVAMAAVPPAAREAPTRAASPWAAQAGTDAVGAWADLTLAGIQVRFRYCQPGSFRIGSPADEVGRKADEDGTTITLTHGFWMAETSLTQGAYLAVAGSNPSHFNGDVLPVESVTWDEAIEFCKKASALAHATLELPSEAQWEYACRAGSDEAFPSAGASAVCWSSEVSDGRTHPVGQLIANAWGLKDMQGDVMQWCGDTSVPYPAQPATDWRGVGGVLHPARGGSWCVDAGACRAAARARYGDSARYFFLGLRPIIVDR